ncbi:MAG: hypothetical protein Q7U08_08510 [Flavobacteriaceae bacterium]|nr:hypothetical protein [Flavobacteriaceae bacterium]
MIIHLKYFIPKSFSAFTFYPFIFIRNKVDTTNITLIHHEKIHLKQQVELLIVFFFLVYFLEFCWNFIRYKSWMKAYHNIGFEKEAYQNEAHQDYIKTRKPYSFLKFHFSSN